MLASVPSLGSLPAGDLGLLALFVLGALGSAHCLGMCGPLVTLYADRVGTPERGPTWSELRQHALWNAGRTLSYAIIGAAMGALGAAVFDAAALAAVGTGTRAAVGLVVGLVIVAAGVRFASGGAVGAGALPLLERPVRRLSRVVVPRVDRLATGPGVVVLGAVHGLLPCPLLYPLFLFALSTGSPVRGAVSMLAFGFGTVPALFLYGTALGSLGVDARRRLHRGLGVCFVLLGTVPLANALALLGIHLPHPALPMPP